jgi:hypothetical protein
MAVFLYVPAVAVQRWTGLAAETAEILVTMAMVVACLALSAAIMARAGLEDQIERFLIMGAIVTMLLPRFDFSEREHIAFLLMLPVLVLAGARGGVGRIPFWLVATAGVAAGVASAIKPHLILAMLVPAVWLVVRARSVKPAFAPENLIAASVFGGFLGLVIIAYPAYFATIVPMEMDTYIHVRQPPATLLFDPLFVTAAALIWLTYLLRRRDSTARMTIVFLLSALGFALAYIEQGKGWRYQFLPCLSLVVLAFGLEVVPQLPGLLRARRPLAALGALVGFLGLAPLVLLNTYTYAISLPFAPIIVAIAPKPRVYALSTDLGVGHPLARAVGGTWVGTTCSQLIMRMAKLRRDLPGTDAATRARMERWIDWDRDRIAEALADGRPDVIVYDPATFDWTDLVSARPAIGRMLANYTKTAEANGADLLVRRDLLTQKAGLRR